MSTFFFRRHLLVLLLFFVCSHSVFPQNGDSLLATIPDSVAPRRLSCVVRETKFGQRMDLLPYSRVYRMFYLGVPMIACGLVVKGEDTHFRHLRNEYMPQFRRHVDDFLQYAPAAVMLGMKAFGVEGRSSWPRMLVSDAFSAALMAGAVNLMKHTSDVTRPDGSNNHSFPSGHTATAFLTATLLTKEYGHRTPWVGIGAYTVATSTGLMRMMNNKHWLSDVLTGAGIGILSAELGYFFADLIFKEKGLNSMDKEDYFDRCDIPSFVSLYCGVNIPLSEYDIDEEIELRTSSGGSIGIEGAAFFNPYIGVGGRTSVANTSIITNRQQAENSRFYAGSICVGPYFSYPISVRWLVGSKLLVGWLHYPELKLIRKTIEKRNGVCFGTGLSATFRAEEYYGIRFFLDYNLLPSHSKASREWMSMLTLGASFMITL